ncbi:MAG: putative toxin-antitoxin system toxin component, PIN family [Acidobacteriota bacterium]
MRVVIDTNVLVSGVINPHGPPGRIVDAALAEAFTVLYDDRILSEYRAVLSRPTFGFKRADVDALVDFIEVAGEPTVAQHLAVVLPDASDLPFLEVAAGGHAHALITGNVKHFKPRRGRHIVDVCTPADFLSRLTQS